MLDMRSLSFITTNGGLALSILPLATDTDQGRETIRLMAVEYVEKAEGTGGGALFDVAMILYAHHTPAAAVFCDAVEEAVFS